MSGKITRDTQCNVSPEHVSNDTVHGALKRAGISAGEHGAYKVLVSRCGVQQLQRNTLKAAFPGAVRSRVLTIEA